MLFTVKTILHRKCNKNKHRCCITHTHYCFYTPAHSQKHTRFPAASSSSSPSRAEAIISSAPLGPLQAQMTHPGRSAINDPHAVLSHTHTHTHTLSALFSVKSAVKETQYFSSLRRCSEAKCLFTITPRGLWERETSSGTKDDVSANSCWYVCFVFLLPCYPAICLIICSSADMGLRGRGGVKISANEVQTGEKPATNRP